MKTFNLEKEEEIIEFLSECRRMHLMMKNEVTGEIIKATRELFFSIHEFQNRVLIPSWKINSGETSATFSVDCKKILNAFFKKYNTPLAAWRDIKSKSFDFFTFKKSYQISHANGILNKCINSGYFPTIELSNYFAASIFSDYYECLPLIFSPFLDKITPNPKDKRGPTLLRYVEFSKTLKNPIFNLIASSSEKYYRLRNSDSHGLLLFKGSEVVELDIKKEKFEIYSESEFMGYFKKTMSTHICYATELDLSLLNRIPSGDIDALEIWLEYFDTYITSFEKLVK